MSRIPRVIVPGIPHHVTQRGSRRQPVFYRDDDRRKYLHILKEQAGESGVTFWAYCLMDNHVHLIAVPEQEKSLALCMAETHRRYSRFINLREGWTGHLWQGRFGSFPLEERHLYAAIRYVELNPVRAGIVESAQDYPWSSAKSHVTGQPDPLLSGNFLEEKILDWSAFLNESDTVLGREAFKKHERTGRPLGEEAFVHKIATQVGRDLRLKKPGPKRSN